MELPDEVILLNKEEIIKKNLIQYTGLNTVYALLNNDTLIYIGRSKNILLRLITHKSSYKFTKVGFSLTGTGKNTGLVERYLIKKYHPKSNVQFIREKTIRPYLPK